MALFVGFIIFFDRYGEILLVKAWETDPANAYEVGRQYVKEGRLEDAARKFEIAEREAKAGRGYWPAWKVRNTKLELGEVYYALGEYDKAVPLLRDVVEKAAPIRAGVPLFHLAEAYLKQGDKEKAADLFRKTTEYNFGSESAIAFFRLGELAAEKGEYESALGYLDTAVTLDAGSRTLTGQMWGSIATIAREAVTETHDATSALARELLGVSEYRLNELDASVEELKGALQAGRDTQRVHYFLVHAYRAQGAHDKAKQHFSRLPGGRLLIKGKDLIHTSGFPSSDAWVLIRNGNLRHEVFSADRVREIEVLAKGTSADFVSAKMVVSLAGERLGEVETSDADFERYTFPSSVSKEHGLLEIEFTNDYRDPETGEDRNLYVEEVALKYSS
jgi:Tfp pilus assembly protein PilF